MTIARSMILLLVVCSLSAIAQTYPITNIKISLPNNPVAAVSSWPASALTIAVSANKEIDLLGGQNKILVSIKKGGAQVCGSYSPASAPKFSFDNGAKTWNGRDALALIGQTCTLPPGDYQLAVQIFNYNNGKTIATSAEQTRPFAIKDEGMNTAANTKIPVSPPDMRAADTIAKKNGGGVSINFGGLGIRLGRKPAPQTIPACGEIIAATRITCAGRSLNSNGLSYNITIKFTNKPYDGVKACAFNLSDIKVLSKGTISEQSAKLPQVIASTESVIYTFKYTPAAKSTEDAKFNLLGTWDNNAIMPELKPVIKLPACLNCDCGTWDDLKVAGVSAAIKYSPENKINWKCGQVFKFSTVYQCTAGAVAGDCKATTAWEITKDGAILKTGTGANTAGDEFTPSGNGIYTIALNARCSDVPCAQVVYTLMVADCQTDTPVTPQNPVTPVVAVVTPPVNTTLVNTVTTLPNTTAQGNPQHKKQQQVTSSVPYYVIKPEYTGEVVNVKDTLCLQIENNYSSATNQFTYTISNLANNKTSAQVKLNVANNQGMIRVMLPLQKSVVGTGEPGMLVLNDYKRYYYISFKRN